VKLLINAVSYVKGIKSTLTSIFPIDIGYNSIDYCELKGTYC
jgi:hypothetical protein